MSFSTLLRYYYAPSVPHGKRLEEVTMGCKYLLVLSYFEYLVLGHFFPLQGLFSSSVITVALGVILDTSLSRAPFRPLG
jgi:hypothetical protein